MSDFLSTVIPSAPIPPREGNPKSMILIAGPKIGKTTCAAALPGALHIVCDPNGGDFVSSLRVDVNAEAARQSMGRYGFLMKLCNELSKCNPRKFRRLIIDKLDNIELWADMEATAYYKNTVIGRNFTGRSIRELEKGGGYPLFWDSFTKIWTAIVSAADEVLFLAALKETELDRQGPVQTFSRKDMDLTGKIRNIAASYADLIGIMSRSQDEHTGDDVNYISFRTSDTGVLSGSRISRLEGKMIEVSRKDAKTGEVKVDWSAIYKD